MSPSAKNRATLDETHPDIAAQWHPTRNGQLAPQEVTYGSDRRVWWLCPECGHEWQAKVSSRSAGRRCPECADVRKRKVAGGNDLATAHPDLAAQWHPTKNGDLVPQEVSRGSDRRVWWLCPVCGHEWEAKVCNRSHGSGCPECAAKHLRELSAAVPGKTDLATTHPDLATQWHPTRNGGFVPQGVSYGSDRKVWWLCPECGHEWQAKVSGRTDGRGCPECAKRRGGRRAVAGVDDLATTHPDLAAQWHPTRNGELTPQTVTHGSGRKVWWICPECGHEWEAAVCERSRGTGCPECARRRRRRKRV